MGNYIKAPGGNIKEYNSRLNGLLSFIGKEFYCSQNRRLGIVHIIEGVKEAKKAHIKFLLKNKRCRINENSRNNRYVYNIHKKNSAIYVIKILECVKNNQNLLNYVKNLYDNDSGKISRSNLNLILQKAIMSLQQVISEPNNDEDALIAQDILKKILLHDFDI